MRGANFVSFFTVQGFFMGIIFSLLKTESPEDVLLYTFLITGFCYLFAHGSVAFYFRTLTDKAMYFPKEKHESDLDFFVREINNREGAIDTWIEVHAKSRKREQA